jgi:hypothetical protein
VIEHVRSRSYDAHTSVEDIEKLRELVDVCLSHEVAKRKFAWVIDSCLIHIRVLIDMHGAEFVAFEYLAIHASPVLFEEDRSWTLQFDKDGYKGDKR